MDERAYGPGPSAACVSDVASPLDLLLAYCRSARQLPSVARSPAAHAGSARASETARPS